MASRPIRPMDLTSPVPAMPTTSVVEGGGGQLAVDRDRQALGGGALGVRERAGRVSEVGEARLQVERDGIVNLIPDAVLVEMALERVAVRRGDDELVVDVQAVRRLVRQ